MPKIYNEIVIDMNPQSPSFEKVLYEDSFEYSGDMILAQEPTGTTGHEGEKATVGVRVGEIYFDPFGAEISQAKYESEGREEYEAQMGGGQFETKFRPKEGYTQKAAFKVIKFQNSAWVATEEKAAQGTDDMIHYDDISKAPSYAEGGSKEWGAANISKADFLDDNNNPLTIEQVYSNLDPKLPNITGEPLKAQIKDMMPKYQKVSEEEKGFLAKEKGFAEQEAKMGMEGDMYGLQKEAGKVGAAMRGAYGGMGGGMRGAMRGGAAMGKEFGMTQDAYGLAMDKASFAEEKGLYGLEKGATSAFETDVAGTLETDWFSTPEGGAQVTPFEKGGYVSNSEETFLDILTRLPEAGGS